MSTGTQVEVVMPQMGVSVSEGTVTRWLKQPGEAVALDEPLLEISTDKVDTEVPSPGEGVVAEIRVQEGETVEVGTVLAVIVPEGSAVAEPSDRAGAGSGRRGGTGSGRRTRPRRRRRSRRRHSRPRRLRARRRRPRRTATAGRSSPRSWRVSRRSTASTRAASRAPARVAA